jgi:hypothetical protein
VIADFRKAPLPVESEGAGVVFPHAQPDLVGACYSQVIVARDARDYTWIMARTPAIPQADCDALLETVKAPGYPMDKIRKVPQGRSQAIGR